MGYVFTYPGSFYALTGMEWVWGICIGVGHLLYNTIDTESQNFFVTL